MTTLMRAAIVLAALLAALPARAEPTLRPAVTVADAVIRLGDLFRDAGPHADDPVANAPAPGVRVGVSADWLAAIAHAHGLSWTPGTVYDQATIERAGRTIDADAITRQLLSAIGERQSVADAELELDNPALRMVVPAAAAEAPSVDELVVDQRTGRISAVLAASPDDPAAVRQRVTGRLVYRVALPMLNRPLAPGATISAGDVTPIKIRRDRIGVDVATDAAQLIGKTPVRPLRAAEPVRLGDIAMPILVHKGELVIVVLETASLSLTAQGKALEDGTLGALVRIENTKSARIIDASVTGPGTAAIAGPNAAAAAAARLAAR